MTDDLFSTSLPITRLRYTAQMRDPLVLHDYAGGLLRSVLGAALKRQCQHTGPCGQDSGCTYAAVFETPPPPEGHPLQAFSEIPKPYVIEPPDLTIERLAAGDALQFHMVLVGSARQHVAAISAAWQDALTQGLGPHQHRARAELLSVEVMADGPVLPPPPSALEALTLKLHTPLRLQHQGQPLRVNALSLRALVAALVRRIALVMAFHAGQPQWGEHLQGLTLLADELGEQRDLRWHDWQRYSQRQKQAMTLGGVVGQWTLRGDAGHLAALWPWLWLGQWLHLGKNATMGMGGYTLEAQQLCDQGGCILNA